MVCDQSPSKIVERVEQVLESPELGVKEYVTPPSTFSCPTRNDRGVLEVEFS